MAPDEGKSWVEASGPWSCGVSYSIQPEEKDCLRGDGLPEDPWSSALKPAFPLSPSPQDMFDKTKAGRIDVHGFSALWKFIQQWKNLFQQYDRDHSGSISYTELQQGEVPCLLHSLRAGPFL